MCSEGLSYIISHLALINTYAVGTQKNRLIETILLITHNIGFEGQIRILDHERPYLSRALLFCRAIELIVQEYSPCLQQHICTSQNTITSELLENPF